MKEVVDGGRQPLRPRTAVPDRAMAQALRMLLFSPLSSPSLLLLCLPVRRAKVYRGALKHQRRIYEQC